MKPLRNEVARIVHSKKLAPRTPRRQERQEEILYGSFLALLASWRSWRLSALIVATTLLCAQNAFATTDGQFYRLFEGITAYIDNPDGKDFTVGLDVRDLNLVANGPREVLFKVYDPDGNPVVREIIPDDGCVSPNFPDRIAGWDQEFQYYANLYARGTSPSYRWSAW